MNAKIAKINSTLKFVGLQYFEEVISRAVTKAHCKLAWPSNRTTDSCIHLGIILLCLKHN